ncbi:winged helix-turn-helix transcriptional regulator [Xanthocytophaga flava]|uniref:winged helix-turn-helix transcriptional regulator n=1 Tax=Xanthocytophaga flava TaxID=3048013 RepID=UPI0028D57D67|nr:helix-turn-helix domain-containing protein [Xanthocytophaga flavus]MDJ1473144.1 helix-turn-helix domain-containing protein [Xanthocytophaga flavus]
MLTQDGGCPKSILAIKDAIETMDGRWKLPILISLSAGTKRFKEIAKDVQGISDKMLSKELKELELNKLITREVSELSVVEYSITEHGKSLEKVMKELYDWGLEHRRQIIGK